MVRLCGGTIFQITQPVNGSGGKIRGFFEVGEQAPFTCLPEPFDGFGAIANDSYSDSTTVSGPPIPQSPAAAEQVAALTMEALGA